jgi:hypothetical protein
MVDGLINEVKEKEEEEDGLRSERRRDNQIKRRAIREEMYVEGRREGEEQGLEAEQKARKRLNAERGRSSLSSQG